MAHPEVDSDFGGGRGGDPAADEEPAPGRLLAPRRRRGVELGVQPLLEAADELHRGEVAGGAGAAQRGGGLEHPRLLGVGLEAGRAAVAEDGVDEAAETAVAAHSGSSSRPAARRSARSWSTLALAMLTSISCAVSRTESPRRKRSSSTRR